MQTRARWQLLVGLCLACVLPLGCDDDDAVSSKPAVEDQADASLDPRDAAAPSSSPLYVGATRVFTESESIGYMFAVPSLDQGTEVDLEQAVELTDAWVFGNADPYFFTATIFEPEITRWQVSPEGRFSKGPVVSFANEGVGGTYTAAFTPLFSQDKSYFIDPVSMQVVVWSPAEMAFLHTIAIDADPIDDFTPNMDLSVRGDQLVVSIFWTSELSGWTKYGKFVRTVVIDTASDEVIATYDDERCGAISAAGAGSDGTLYFSPWDYHTVIRDIFGPDFGVRSCGLRMAADGDSLDPDYQVDLASLVGGRPAGGLKLLDDDTALLHVWHDDLVQATKQDWEDTRSKPGYLWYRWQLGEDTAEPLPDQEPSSEGGEWRTLDERTVTYAANAEYSETTLFELDSDGRQKQLLSVPGWITQIIRAH
ncbi:MAG: hypothetical protein ABW321_32690 [Polyangiales bacterium]